MKKLSISIAFVICIFLAGVGQQSVMADELLTISNSDSALEQEILDYLARDYGWVLSLKHVQSDPQDGYMHGSFDVTQDEQLVEDVIVIIDVEDYIDADNGDRSVARVTWGIYCENEGGRVHNLGQALSWLNHWHRTKWSPLKLYVDSNNDLYGRTFILLDENGPLPYALIGVTTTDLIDSFVEAILSARENGVL